MIARKIASRYAEALFDLAQQNGTTERWEQDLAALAGVITASPEFSEVLTHPEIPTTRKQAMVERTFAGKIAPEVQHLLTMLIRRGHEPDIATIHTLFVARWNQVRRVVPVTVTSAVPLTESQATALARTLARRTGATIQLHQTTDPGLLAGMVVTIGDRVIDASARTTLDALRTAMSGA